LSKVGEPSYAAFCLKVEDDGKRTFPNSSSTRWLDSGVA